MLIGIVATIHDKMAIGGQTNLTNPRSAERGVEHEVMMARLDSRLLPLIETLAAADADWLAFEILDGLQQGRVAEETHDDLHSTQIAVRKAERATRRSEEPALPPPAAEPIVADEQIEWAADYIAKRMSDAVLMVGATLDQLDEVTSGAQPLDRGPLASGAKEGVTLILQTQDERLSVRKGEAANARAALPKLREALLAWVASTRNTGLNE